MTVGNIRCVGNESFEVNIVSSLIIRDELMNKCIAKLDKHVLLKFPYSIMPSSAANTSLRGFRSSLLFLLQSKTPKGCWNQDEESNKLSEPCYDVSNGNNKFFPFPSTHSTCCCCRLCIVGYFRRYRVTVMKNRKGTYYWQDLVGSPPSIGYFQYYWHNPTHQAPSNYGHFPGAKGDHIRASSRPTTIYSGALAGLRYEQ